MSPIRPNPPPPNPWYSIKMVGLVRFELTTSCTPCKRATRLRYSPNKEGQKVACSPRKQVVFLLFAQTVEKSPKRTAELRKATCPVLIAPPAPTREEITRPLKSILTSYLTAGSAPARNSSLQTHAPSTPQRAPSNRVARPSSHRWLCTSPDSSRAQIGSLHCAS